MNHAEAKSAYDAALTAEHAAQVALDAAIEAKRTALLSASRTGVAPDDKTIIAAAAAVTTASTRLDMAAMVRADAETAMHQAEIDWLTDEAARLVTRYADAGAAATAAGDCARQAFADAQTALAEWQAAHQARAVAAGDAAHFDASVDATWAKTNPILADQHMSTRPKTRIRPHGIGRHVTLQLAGPVGERVPVNEVR